MAPINPNNTIRYWIDYQVASVEHTLLCRANAVFSPSDLGTSVDAFFTALTNILSLTTILRARFAPAGSNISQPITLGIVGNTYGAGVPGSTIQSTFLDFVGRTASGRRSRVAVFGYKGDLSDFRLNNSEQSAVAAAVAELNSEANGWLAIDNTKPTWYPYANTGLNAYWQRNLRT